MAISLSCMLDDTNSLINHVFGSSVVKLCGEAVVEAVVAVVKCGGSVVHAISVID